MACPVLDASLLAPGSCVYCDTLYSGWYIQFTPSCSVLLFKELQGRIDIVQRIECKGLSVQGIHDVVKAAGGVACADAVVDGFKAIGIHSAIAHGVVPSKMFGVRQWIDMFVLFYSEMLGTMI